MQTKGILIGGKALNVLGSNRLTFYTDYLINDTTSIEPIIHDQINKNDYYNANGNEFFAKIYAMEAGREVASPQALLELKAYSFVRHCLNANWHKVNDAEYDLKFLVLKFGLKDCPVAKKFMTLGEYSEVIKVINSAKKR